jgi:hypothetical protein
MDCIEFLRLIEKTDEELARQSRPLHVRPFAAFTEIARDYQGPVCGYGIDPRDFPEYVGPNLMGRIHEWYRKRYGDRVNVPSTLGRVPFLIRGQVFTARIQLAYGQPQVNPLEFVDKMTDDMKRALTRQELKHYAERWVMGYELIYEIVDLLGSGDLSQFTPEVAELIRKAIEDRDDAVECLQGTHPRTNISCFHSQQYAEKMMKTVLIAKAGMSQTTMKKIGHRINDLLVKCLKVTSAFTNVQTDAALLANIPMGIRYEITAVDSSVAVETYFAALRIGGLCATQLSGHQRRLGTSNLIDF